jgi:hypothetical protein
MGAGGVGQQRTTRGRHARHCHEGDSRSAREPCHQPHPVNSLWAQGSALLAGAPQQTDVYQHPRRVWGRRGSVLMTARERKRAQVGWMGDGVFAPRTNVVVVVFLAVHGSEVHTELLRGCCNLLRRARQVHHSWVEICTHTSAHTHATHTQSPAPAANERCHRQTQHAHTKVRRGAGRCTVHGARCTVPRTLGHPEDFTTFPSSAQGPQGPITGVLRCGHACVSARVMHRTHPVCSASFAPGSLGWGQGTRTPG